ncbi:ATP-dependent DNA helicase pif1-like [Ptychodera flava]|uniref:ATP-dependent DNA helicase pif1-like n=1 Tax=Ptychodera flava TaxID=63121 RepID=UPI00396A5347
MPGRNKKVKIVCPTACSIYDNLPIKAETVHSFFGIGLADKPVRDVVNNTKEHVAIRLKEVDILILDEMSMLSARVFNIVSIISQRSRENRLPFGGMQIIGVGDFHQLPPVPDFIDQGDYAFLSPLWKLTFRHTILLTTIYRQQDSQRDLIHALNSIRIGRCDEDTFNFLMTLRRPLINQNSTHIYFNNIDADCHNMCELDNMPGKYHVFQSVDQGNHREIEKGCIAPKTLFVKEGAPVMLLYNLSQELHNGCIGTFRGVDANGHPLVMFMNKNVQCSIPRKTWTVKDDTGKEIGRRSQHPLKLCWAITSHKSQGQTLPSIVVHAGSEFVPGQLYVALSRAKSTETIQLIGFSQARMLPVNESVATFYSSLPSYDVDVHLACCTEEVQNDVVTKIMDEGVGYHSHDDDDGFVEDMYAREADNEDFVDLREVYVNMEKKGNCLEDLPSDFCLTTFLHELRDSTPFADVVGSLAWHINSLVDHILSNPDTVLLFVRIQWLKIYGTVKREEKKILSSDFWTKFQERRSKFF